MGAGSIWFILRMGSGCQEPEWELWQSQVEKCMIKVSEVEAVCVYGEMPAGLDVLLCGAVGVLE